MMMNSSTCLNMENFMPLSKSCQKPWKMGERRTLAGGKVGGWRIGGGEEKVGGKGANGGRTMTREKWQRRLGGEEEKRERKSGKVWELCSPRQHKAWVGAKVPGKRPCGVHNTTIEKEERKRKKRRKRRRGRMGKEREKLRNASMAWLGLIRYSENTFQVTKTIVYRQTKSETYTKYVWT